MLVLDCYLIILSHVTDMSQVAGLEEFLDDRNGFLGVANHFCRPIGQGKSKGALAMSASSSASSAPTAGEYTHDFLVKATKVSLFSNLNFDQSCSKLPAVFIHNLPRRLF